MQQFIDNVQYTLKETSERQQREFYISRLHREHTLYGMEKELVVSIEGILKREVSFHTICNTNSSKE